MSMQTISQTRPDWVSPELYPFQDRYMEVDGQPMHYVDEGSGETIVFVHGTPTWSFLWRNMIKKFSGQYRCIAPDHLGYGLSGKDPKYAYSAKQLAQNFETFIEKLKLEKFTLVVHDFGGPIGLNYAIKHPEKVKRIVLFNTWMWETKTDPEVQKINRILKSCMGKFLYRHMNFSPKVLLKKGFHDKKKLSKTVHQHYTKAFPKAKDRQGPYQIGLSLMGDSDWFAQLWQQRDKISHKPFLVIWGKQDAFFQQAHLDKWKAVLSNYQLKELEAGHFPQEEFPEEVNSAISQFLNAD